MTDIDHIMAALGERPITHEPASFEDALMLGVTRAMTACNMVLFSELPRYRRPMAPQIKKLNPKREKQKAQRAARKARRG